MDGNDLHVLPRLLHTKRYSPIWPCSGKQGNPGLEGYLPGGTGHALGDLTANSEGGHHHHHQRQQQRHYYQDQRQIHSSPLKVISYFIPLDSLGDVPSFLLTCLVAGVFYPF